MVNNESNTYKIGTRLDMLQQLLIKIIMTSTLLHINFEIFFLNCIDQKIMA